MRRYVWINLRKLNEMNGNFEIESFRSIAKFCDKFENKVNLRKKCKVKLRRKISKFGMKLSINLRKMSFINENFEIQSLIGFQEKFMKNKNV